LSFFVFRIYVRRAVVVCPDRPTPPFICLKFHISQYHIEDSDRHVCIHSTQYPLPLLYPVDYTIAEIMHIMSRVVTSLHILLCNHQPIFANGLKVVPLLSPLRLRTRRGYSVTAIISNRRIVSKPPAIPSRHVISSAVKMTRGDNSNDDTNDDAHDSNDGEWTTFDPKTCQGVYGLGISAVAPRPVAVITSRSKNGTLNCAPFS
jgi:hypothetical protein